MREGKKKAEFACAAMNSWETERETLTLHDVGPSGLEILRKKVRPHR